MLQLNKKKIIFPYENNKKKGIKEANKSEKKIRSLALVLTFIFENKPKNPQTANKRDERNMSHLETQRQWRRKVEHPK